MEGVTLGKRKREENDDFGDLDLDDDFGLTAEEADAILADAEENAEEKTESLDHMGLKSLLSVYEGALAENRRLRIKHSGEPSMFMDSEIELDVSVQKLSLVASAPHLYQDFVDMKGSEKLLQALEHENSDIVRDCIDVLVDLTNPEIADDTGADASRVIVLNLVMAGVVELLVATMKRFKESISAESDGWFECLHLIENLLDTAPELADTIAGRTDLLNVLLARIGIKGFHPNRLYASEIMNVLLQTEPANRKRVGQVDALTVFLKSIAYYRRRDPKDADEVELLENLFNCLCALMMYPPNRRLLVKVEGIELLVLLIKEKRFARGPAVKLVDHCLNENPSGCRKLVDLYGLKTVFALFMKKVTLSKRFESLSDQDLDEHIISIIGSLFKNLSGFRLGRLLSKFKENGFEKIERLLEFHMHYERPVLGVERKHKERDAEIAGGKSDFDELLDSSNQRYLDRLEAGLYIVQMADFVVGSVASVTSTYGQEVRAHIKLLLRQRGRNLTDIKSRLMEMAEAGTGAGAVKLRETVGAIVAELSREDTGPTLMPTPHPLVTDHKPS